MSPSATDYVTTLALDLTDFAAQQAVKHFLALRGVSYMSDPNDATLDPVLVQARNAFTHYAEDMALVVSDGTTVELLAHAGGYVAEYDIDAIGRDSIVRECLDPLPDGHAAGLWCWRGRVRMVNNGRGWDELYDEWVGEWAGEWHLATRADCDLLSTTPEQWACAEGDLHDAVVVAALRAQFPDADFHERDASAGSRMAAGVLALMESLDARAGEVDPCPKGDPDCETGDDGSCHDACVVPVSPDVPRDGAR